MSRCVQSGPHARSPGGSSWSKAWQKQSCQKRQEGPNSASLQSLLYESKQHICVDAAPQIQTSIPQNYKTSENIYSLPVWFWQFRRRLVRFVQNDNGGTTNARTETSECSIRLYKVIRCLQSSSSLPIISGVWAQTLRHNSAMAQSDLQLPTLWQACHQSCTFSSFGFYIYCSAGRLCTTVVCTLHDQIQWHARTRRKMERWKDVERHQLKIDLTSGHLILVSDDVQLENRTWKPTKPARITSAMNSASTKRQNDRKHTWQYSACLTLQTCLIIWVTKHLQLGLLLHSQVLKPLY